jgi:hypothetical protein
LGHVDRLLFRGCILYLSVSGESGDLIAEQGAWDRWKENQIGWRIEDRAATV